MPVMPDAAILAPSSHDQAHTTARAYALRLGASGRREVSDKLWHALAKSECDQPKTGDGDCEKEVAGNEFITCPHDRTPLFDQNLDRYAEPSIHRAARRHLLG
jgi:hypothetical protein